MKTRAELHAYWRNPEEKNSPKTYVNHPERTEYLVGLMQRYAELTDRIWELGCNVGRNLNGLWIAGYREIEGVEINNSAVDLMRLTYPDMRATVYRGKIEDMIRFTGSDYLDAADVIFTMCVLMHIHPDSEFVFGEIARLAEKYIITIEDEVKETWRHCPRNYRGVFEPFGFEQVFMENIPWGEHGCVARVMKRVDAS